MKIFITTPLGNVGAATLSALATHPNRLALTIVAGDRNPAKNRAALTARTDDVILFDFAKPETVAPALAGVSRVLLVRPPALADVDKYFRPFVESMKQAGVQQVVFLSLEGVENNSLTPHHKIEALIREAGLGYTMLRPGFFMQNLSTTHLVEIRDRSEIFVPAGNGRTNFVDVADIATVAAQALAAGQHLNTALTLTGSQALTYSEIAEILTDILGRKITYINPSVLRFIWQKVVQEKMKFGFVLIMVALYSVAKLGKAATLTDTIARLLGRPPKTFRQFAEENRSVWQ
jgi:uncharacterized protein YbjT (DUF2867 family)